MQGSLFTRDFLLEGITETPPWAAVSVAEVGMFRDAVGAAFAKFPVDGNPNENTTEHDLIYPVLRALGWTDFLTQQKASARGREDVPDVLLFADAGEKARANKERRPEQRYKHGLAIVENKAWNLPLDRGPPDLFNQGAPSTQMLRYLTRVEIASDRRIAWGILTNGRLWRLYFQGARSRSEEFLELDLPVVAGVPGVTPDLFTPTETGRDHLLKVFLLMFGRAAFLPSPEDKRTFHQLALERTREWEARVSSKLGDDVFQGVFPALVRALRKADREAPSPLTPEYLGELRRSALTLLYRLLFVLYAEDRNLLPTHDPRYDDYSLNRLRHDIQDRIDRGDRLSGRATDAF